eukprot:7390407-Alexandrium_andersonii.AAC.1
MARAAPIHQKQTRMPLASHRATSDSFRYFGKNHMLGSTGNRRTAPETASGMLPEAVSGVVRRFPVLLG